eukprot:scaffold227220_cov17-Tisochrysis_lutea.AAC.1
MVAAFGYLASCTSTLVMVVALITWLYALLRGRSRAAEGLFSKQSDSAVKTAQERVPSASSRELSQGGCGVMESSHPLVSQTPQCFLRIALPKSSEPERARSATCVLPVWPSQPDWKACYPL